MLAVQRRVVLALRDSACLETAHRSRLVVGHAMKKDTKWSLCWRDDRRERMHGIDSMMVLQRGV